MKTTYTFLWTYVVLLVFRPTDHEVDLFWKINFLQIQVLVFYKQRRRKY